MQRFDVIGNLEKFLTFHPTKWGLRKDVILGLIGFKFDRALDSPINVLVLKSP
jgi:hypothetical protein